MKVRYYYSEYLSIWLHKRVYSHSELRSTRHVLLSQFYVSLVINRLGAISLRRFQFDLLIKWNRLFLFLALLEFSRRFWLLKELFRWLEPIDIQMHRICIFKDLCEFILLLWCWKVNYFLLTYVISLKNLSNLLLCVLRRIEILLLLLWLRCLPLLPLYLRYIVTWGISLLKVSLPLILEIGGEGLPLNHADVDWWIGVPVFIFNNKSSVKRVGGLLRFRLINKIIFLRSVL